MRLDLRARTESPAYWTGENDSADIFHIANLLPDGATILDIGANIGFWSIQLGNLLRKTGP